MKLKHFTMVKVFTMLIFTLGTYNFVFCQDDNSTVTEKKERLNKLRTFEKLLGAPRSSYDYSSFQTSDIHGSNYGHSGGMDYYTGTYRTSINLSDGISISYSNNGIAVDQVATWVGLGWNLSVGGKIKRTVRGYPDDLIMSHYDSNQDAWYNFYGWNNSDGTALPSPSEMVQDLPINSNDADGSLNLEYFISNKGVYDNSTQETTFDKHDSEPDLFQFTFPGGIGSFVFSDEDISSTDNRKKIKPLIYSDLKFSYTRGVGVDYKTIIGFTIKDRNGVTYIFDELETINTNSGVYPEPFSQPLVDPTYPTFQSGTFSNFLSLESGYTQSWYLTKIIYPDKSEINFEYDDEYIALETEFYENIRAYDYSTNTGIDNSKMVRNFDFGEGYPEAVLKSKRISKITGDDFEIDFIANNLREDLKLYGTDPAFYPKSLDKIKVYNIFNGNKTISKQIDFKYSYFTSDPDPVNGVYDNKGYGIYYIYNNPYGEYIYKRLKLDEISIYNGNQLLPPYKFDYYTHEDDYEDEYWLPARHSYCKDIFGYFKEYNTSTTEESLIPEVYVYKNRSGKYRFSLYQFDDATSGVGTAGEDILDGADRLPNDESIADGNDIVVGMLKSVLYPTGMQTDYEYEQNSFVIEGIAANTFIGGGLRVSKITNSGDNIPDSYTEYTYETNTGLSSGKLITMPQFGHYDPVNMNCTSTQLNNLSYSSFDEDDFNNFYLRGTANEMDMSDGIMGYSRVKEVSGGVDGYTVYNFIDDATYNDYSNIEYTYYSTPNIDIYPSYEDYDASISYYDGFDIPYVLDNIGLDLTYDYPYQPNSNYTWHRGKLKSKEVFDGDGNAIMQDENTFSFFYGADTIPEIVYGLKNTYLRNNVLPIDGGNCGNTETIWDYLLIPLTVSCKYEIQTGVDSYVSSSQSNYIPEPGKEISDSKSYEHNDYGLLSKESYTDEEGNTITTRYTYVCDIWDLSNPVPDDINIETDDAKAIFHLISNNRYSELIRKQTYKQISGDNSFYMLGAEYYTFKSVDIGSGNTIEVPYQKYRLVNLAKRPNLNGNPNLCVNLNNKYSICYDKSDYELISTNSEFNNLGNPLEILVENSNPISFIYTNNDRTLLLESANSLESEISYTGFEDYENITWTFPSNYYTSDSKSGSSSLYLTQNQSITKTFTVDYSAYSNGYTSSLWIKGDGRLRLTLNVNGTQLTKNVEASSASWKLLSIALSKDELKQFENQQITIQVVAQNIDSPTIYIDDIMFAPDDAEYNVYIYNEKSNITSAFNSNNIYSHYYYDDFGRITYTTDNDGYILSTHENFLGHPCDFVYYPANDLHTEIKVGESINFVANVKDSSDGEFEFGSGGSTVNLNSSGIANYTFTSAGEYTVTLTMTLNGQQYAKSQLINVLAN